MRARRFRTLALTLVTCLTALSALAPSAGAAIQDEFLFRFGSGYGSEPGAAGKLETVSGVAGHPATGHVFLAGSGANSNRVSEFTPWGEFVKAFGWDVAPGAVNETQELRVRASSGTIKLGFEAAITPDLPFNASGEEVEDALNALTTIGGAAGSVSVAERVGSTDGTIPYVHTIVFEGSLAGEDVQQITATGGSLAGGEPSTVLEANTRADGTPGGTGLEVCTSESGCQAGVAGGGSGQLGNAAGLTLDESGVYVKESLEANNRIQKFDPAGRFLWAAGGDVNKTKVEEGAPVAERNLCTAASGDECQAGVAGTGPGQFGQPPPGIFGGNGVAIGPGGNVYAADVGRIQIFSSGGEYLGDLSDPDSELSGETVRRLAIDRDRDRIYLTLAGKEDVRVLDAVSGNLLGTRSVQKPDSVAVDPDGDLYATEGTKPQQPEHVMVFDSDGEQLLPDAAELLECQKKLEAVVGQCEFFGNADPGFQLRGIGTGPAGNLYIANFNPSIESYVKAFGPPPLAFEAPPPSPPFIAAQYATTVSEQDAQLRAQINPHFFAGSLGTTTYYLQHASAECIEAEGWEGACVEEKPAPPGTPLAAGIVDEEVTTAPIVLEGLAPATEYRYRFVAEGSGAPGVQIVGAGGAPGEEGSEAAFRTYPVPQPPGPCANDAFRTGPAAKLPDCRAYEMVSPVDKQGGDIIVLESLKLLPAVLEQASTSGEKLAYGSYRSFGDAESSPYTTQYIASRGGSGWSSKGISPPRSTQVVVPIGTFDSEFKYFSDDLCEAWARSFADPPLTPSAVGGYSNLYRRDNCSDPHSYEALTTVAPPGVDGPAYLLETQGISTDGQTTIYTANAKLTANAPTPVGQAPLLYARNMAGAMAYVCVLPNGTPSGGPCTAGGRLYSGQTGYNLLTRLDNAISEDGTRVFWTNADGSIYLRQNPLVGTPSTTLVAGPASQYWGAAADGGRAIYEQGGKLFSFEVSGKVTTEISGGVAGVVGMSEDARSVYLVSSEDRDGAGPAAAGEPNLYLWRFPDGGPQSIRFVATLAAADANPNSLTSPTAVAAEPRLRATRVSADGTHAAFMSSAPLTGYDNHDLQSGEADAEVFLYDAAAAEGEGRLTCVSCNPSGARPAGKDIGKGGQVFWVASRIPVAENNLHEARLLSSDGRRLYFESFDSLALSDTNGVKDVYQWEEAGSGTCSEASPSYSPPALGCIELISSGQSSIDSRFVESSPSGSDVFFTTLSSLVPHDPDQVDVYDARVQGGLPAPPQPAPECEGESCQSPAPAPAAQTPGSATYDGPGDLTASPPDCRAPARRAARLSRRANRLRSGARRIARRGDSRRARAAAGQARRLGRKARTLSKQAKRCRATNRRNRR